MPPPSVGPSPSSHLEVLSVTCPVGEIQSPHDSYHVLDFHVGAPVQVTCRLDSRERRGMQCHGEFCVLPAGLVGQWFLGASADALVLRLSPLLVEETADSLGLTPAHARINPAMGMRDPHLEYIGWLLRAEQAEGYPEGRLFVESLASAMAARLVRRWGHTDTPARAPERQLPRWRLRSVFDYIEANLERDLSLAELARVARFSVPHFKLLFRQTVGIPVHRYVVERRVEYARQLLLKGDMGMGDIALAAGFTHQSHMARCIRRVLGISTAEVVALRRVGEIHEYSSWKAGGMDVPPRRR